MKNNIEIEKNRINKGLNILARQIVDQELTPEMIAAHINEKFAFISNKERMNLVKEVMHRSYSYAWIAPEEIKLKKKRKENGFEDLPLGTIIHFIDVLKQCVAMKLARHVIDLLYSKYTNLLTKNSFGITFYKHCLSKIEEKQDLSNIEDIELIEIYLKQIGHIIRKTSFFEKSMQIKENPNEIAKLYLELFFAFWEKISWEEIFPSNPVASKELSFTKMILIDLIVQTKGKFYIRHIANEFFALTGFSEQNDMYMISFLDFYFFTWLSHFGILTYCHPNPEVCAKITPFGKKFLQFLRERA